MSSSQKFFAGAVLPHCLRRKAGFCGDDFGSKKVVSPGRETPLDIVELPPLDHRMEWPTIALAAVIYGLRFVTTYFWRDIMWALAAIGAWVVAWQMNLQHEIIHGRLTPNSGINTAVGVWLLSLWLPFSTYRTTHLRHHQEPISRTRSRILKATTGPLPDGGISAPSRAALRVSGRPSSAAWSSGRRG